MLTVGDASLHTLLHLKWMPLFAVQLSIFSRKDLHARTNRRKNRALFNCSVALFWICMVNVAVPDMGPVGFNIPRVVSNLVSLLDLLDPLPVPP